MLDLYEDIILCSSVYRAGSQLDCSW